MRLIRRLRFEREVIVLARLIRRHAIGIRDARHTWQHRDTPLQLVPERVDAGGILILGAGQSDRSGQDVFGFEAKIDVLQLVEAGEQQPRDDQERRGDRKLRADERAAQTPDADAGG